MDLETALRTTGAVREFQPRAVEDAVVAKIVDTARFAPSGGNRQAWQAVLVKDPNLKRRLRDLYLQAWHEYLSIGAAGLVPWAPITDREAEAAATADAATTGPAISGLRGGFAEHLDEVPVLLVILADLRGMAAVDRDHGRYTFAGGASVYPYAWSLLLAAHDAGLGGVMTTMLVREEAAVKELLGAPPEWAVAAALALGYPASPPPTKLRRAKGYARIDRFDGEALEG
jgi:nitroreductase